MKEDSQKLLLNLLALMWDSLKLWKFSYKFNLSKTLSFHEQETLSTSLIVFSKNEHSNFISNLNDLFQKEKVGLKVSLEFNLLHLQSPCNCGVSLCCYMELHKNVLFPSAQENLAIAAFQIEQSSIYNSLNTFSYLLVIEIWKWYWFIQIHN